MQMGDQSDHMNGMQRAEKINMENGAWLWKETNIWSEAACQSFDGCEKSSKTPCSAWPLKSTLGISWKNICRTEQRPYKWKFIIFPKLCWTTCDVMHHSNVQFWCLEAKQKWKQWHQTRRAWARRECGQRQRRDVRNGFDYGMDSWAASAADGGEEEEGENMEEETEMATRKETSVRTALGLQTEDYFVVD